MGFHRGLKHVNTAYRGISRSSGCSLKPVTIRCYSCSQSTLLASSNYNSFHLKYSIPGLYLGSYVRRCSNASGALQQICVDEPSSWRQLPAMGEVFIEDVEVGSRLVTFETGKLARFAAGAVVLGIKETKVLATVVSAEGDGTRDFLPLTVDYWEKQYAQGKIPNTFMRREGAPKERELLCGRVIDRSIRPLFPTGFYNDIQVIANVLSSDGEQDPDVMAATAASAALTISDIPWNGPIGVLSLSDLNLVYSCTRDKALMIETQAREISNKDLTEALHLAHSEVMCTVTLGAPADAQRLESLVGPPRKRFMVHYSFPPFSINEIGKQVGLSRREVGHGTLAEKALLALLPPEDEFPYSVRVNSEVMASDGSSSMATVCGGSLALMDAGVPLREHVAGVSVGLITEVDTSTGDVKDYRILTDILGLEDHLGDMDFKIAGTRKGVTAVQLDIKPAGIPLHILCECLDPALEARTHILDFMEQEIKVPREQAKGNSPRLVTVRLNRDYLSRLIGPQGSHLKKIEQETGARITVNFDGAVTILAKDQPSLEQTQEKSGQRNKFEVGEELQVLCTSMNNKGIPVFSLLEKR